MRDDDSCIPFHRYLCVLCLYQARTAPTPPRHTAPSEPRIRGEKEVREIARKVYSANPSMSLGEIARAIGISCNRVKEHISDLMAAYESQRDVKLLKLEL